LVEASSCLDAHLISGSPCGSLSFRQLTQLPFHPFSRGSDPESSELRRVRRRPTAPPSAYRVPIPRKASTAAASRPVEHVSRIDRRDDQRHRISEPHRKRTTSMLPPTGPVKLYDDEANRFSYYIIYGCYITCYTILLMLFLYLDECSETDRFDRRVRGRTRTFGPSLLEKIWECETQGCPDFGVDLLARQHGFAGKKSVSPVNGHRLGRDPCSWGSSKKVKTA